MQVHHTHLPRQPHGPFDRNKSYAHAIPLRCRCAVHVLARTLFLYTSGANLNSHRPGPAPRWTTVTAEPNPDIFKNKFGKPISRGRSLFNWGDRVSFCLVDEADVRILPHWFSVFCIFYFLACFFKVDVASRLAKTTPHFLHTRFFCVFLLFTRDG